MISSQLASQLFSKQFTWEILQETYPDQFWSRTAPPELRVEVWEKNVYVCLRKTDKRRGVSLFLSFWDYIDYFMMRSLAKSHDVRVFQVRKYIFNVTSSQGSEGDTYTVNASLFGIKCDCMLFRCLNNRISRELPYYAKLLKQSQFFAGQVVCHHVVAILDRMGFGSMQAYLNERCPRVATGGQSP